MTIYQVDTSFGLTVRPIPLRLPWTLVGVDQEGCPSIKVVPEMGRLTGPVVPASRPGPSTAAILIGLATSTGRTFRRRGSVADHTSDRPDPIRPEGRPGEMATWPMRLGMGVHDESQMAIIGPVTVVPTPTIEETSVGEVGPLGPTRVPVLESLSSPWTSNAIGERSTWFTSPLAGVVASVGLVPRLGVPDLVRTDARLLRTVMTLVPVGSGGPSPSVPSRTF